MRLGARSGRAGADTLNTQCPSLPFPAHGHSRSFRSPLLVGATCPTSDIWRRVSERREIANAWEQARSFLPAEPHCAFATRRKGSRDTPLISPRQRMEPSRWLLVAYPGGALLEGPANPSVHKSIATRQERESHFGELRQGSFNELRDAGSCIHNERMEPSLRRKRFRGQAAQFSELCNHVRLVRVAEFRRHLRPPHS